MSSHRYPPSGGGSSAYYGDPVADVASLPASGTNGELRLVLDVDDIYEWNGASWQRITENTADVQGPASSTDNAVVRFDSTTGKLLQNSAVTIDDSGNIATAGTVDGRDVSTDGSALDSHIAATAAHGATGAVVGTTNAQTLSNKTLTAPVINSPTGIVKADVGLGNVDNTSDATKDAASATLSNKTLASPLVSGGSIDVNAAGALAIGASVGANTMTLGGASTTVVIAGNFQIDGTTTTVNSTTLEVDDANIEVNKGGNDASSEGAGLSVDRTGTNGSLIYKDASATKWAAGAAGSEVDLVGTSSTQTLTNKTFDADANTLSNVDDGNIKAGAAIDAAKIADGSVSNAEFQRLNGVTSDIQSQLNAIRAGKSTVAVSGDVTLTDQAIHLVDCSAARSLTLPTPAASSFIVVKDKTGHAMTNNITIVRAGSEKIETVAASFTLDTDLGSWTFVSDGTDWFII